MEISKCVTNSYSVDHKFLQSDNIYKFTIELLQSYRLQHGQF